MPYSRTSSRPNPSKWGYHTLHRQYTASYSIEDRSKAGYCHGHCHCCWVETGHQSNRGCKGNQASSRRPRVHPLRDRWLQFSPPAESISRRLYDLISWRNIKMTGMDDLQNINWRLVWRRPTLNPPSAAAASTFDCGHTMFRWTLKVLPWQVIVRSEYLPDFSRLRSLVNQWWGRPSGYPSLPGVQGGQSRRSSGSFRCRCHIDDWLFEQTAKELLLRTSSGDGDVIKVNPRTRWKDG